MKACLIYATRFGNTERVARALESGLREAGLETTRVPSSEATVDLLKGSDLVCIGAPTEAFSASKPIKEFLKGLGGPKMPGKYCFAFDTKLDWPLSGSAAKYIEKELATFGLTIIAHRESAIVATVKSGGAISGANLKEGEEERFRQIGLRLGNSLAIKQRTPPAK